MVLALDLLILFYSPSTFLSISHRLLKTCRGGQQGSVSRAEGDWESANWKLKPVCLCTLWGAERPTPPNWSGGRWEFPPPLFLTKKCFILAASLVAWERCLAPTWGVLQGWTYRDVGNSAHHSYFCPFPQVWAFFFRGFIIPVQLWV